MRRHLSECYRTILPGRCQDPFGGDDSLGKISPDLRAPFDSLPDLLDSGQLRRALVVGLSCGKGRRTGNSGANPGRPRRCNRAIARTAPSIWPLPCRGAARRPGQVRTREPEDLPTRDLRPVARDSGRESSRAAGQGLPIGDRVARWSASWSSDPDPALAIAEHRRRCLPAPKSAPAHACERNGLRNPRQRRASRSSSCWW